MKRFSSRRFESVLVLTLGYWSLILPTQSIHLLLYLHSALSHSWCALIFSLSLWLANRVNEIREKNHWSFHDLLFTFVNILMLTLILVFAYAYQTIKELKRNSVHVTDVVQDRINFIIILSSVFFLYTYFLIISFSSTSTQFERFPVA